MTGVMEHCDVIEHLGIVMKGIMEHCDENCPGLLS